MAAKEKTADAPAAKTPSRDPRLDAVLAQIRKEFGDTSIMRLGDASAAQTAETVSKAKSTFLMRNSIPQFFLRVLSSPDERAKIAFVRFRV